MTEKKNILQSKTIWGAIIGMVGVLINQGVIDFMSGAELQEIAGLVGQIGGTVLVIYGRIKAKKRIK